MKKFEFKGFEFRVIERDGEPWFSGQDVSDILGLGKASQAVRYLEDDEKAQVERGVLSKHPEMPGTETIISEPGLYSLILRSRKERAREFKRWVVHEVLPTIRKSEGAYVEPGSRAEFDLTDPDNYMDQLKRVIQIAETEKAKNAELTPRAVGAIGAEERSGGQTIQDVQYALCGIMGVATRMVRDQLRMIGAITARNSGGYLAAPKWSDLLFDTLGPVQKNGYRYPTGVVRIRPGKQDEFLNRVREAYAFRFGVTA